MSMSSLSGAETQLTTSGRPSTNRWSSVSHIRQREPRAVIGLLDRPRPVRNRMSGIGDVLVVRTPLPARRRIEREPASGVQVQASRRRAFGRPVLEGAPLLGAGVVQLGFRLRHLPLVLEPVCEPGRLDVSEVTLRRARVHHWHPPRLAAAPSAVVPGAHHQIVQVPLSPRSSARVGRQRPVAVLLIPPAADVSVGTAGALRPRCTARCLPEGVIGRMGDERLPGGTLP